uniref:BTB domain-containing protein n=1 Tax=Panagrolaimus sp. JU765 TaxID=591449 RepID=A0AC34RHX2_9BILA
MHGKRWIINGFWEFIPIQAGHSLTKPICFANEIDNFHYFSTKENLLRHDYIELNFHLTLTVTTETEQSFKRDSNIVAMLDDDRFKDFVICVGDKEIKVHKNVLAVASPVFSTMLQPHYKEFQESRVTIKDFDYDTVIEAVNLIYTCQLNPKLSIDLLLNLYKFADKYDLNDTEMIIQALEKKLNLESSPELPNFWRLKIIERQLSRQYYQEFGIKKFCIDRDRFAVILKIATISRENYLLLFQNIKL